MTTMSEIDVRCAVCGTLGRKADLTSTSSFGPPDLDLRPHGPARWALEFRCSAATRAGTAPSRSARRRVGAAVSRVACLPRCARAVEAAAPRSHLFCSALVEEAAGRPEASGWDFLAAAWDCDDRSAAGHARSCRQRAAEMLERALERGEVSAPRPIVQTLIAELWRRAGRFEDALAACAVAGDELAETETDGEDGVLPTAAVIAFIRDLSIAGDDEAHSCAEVFAEGE